MSHPAQTIDESALEGEAEPAGPQRYRLVFFWQDMLFNHPLPESGKVIIGRKGYDADVEVDATPLSRRHAQLTVGPPMTIEDLGSSNGTKVRGVALKQGESAPIGVGDAVEMGSVTMIVQR